MTYFDYLGLPLPLTVVRDIPDAMCVIECDTGRPVARWRTDRIVPTPRKAVHT